MLSGVAPLTTLVVNRAFWPRTARAARPVASLVVDAGVMDREPFSESSTRPVDGSATSADTLGPSAGADSGPFRALCRPLVVGPVPWVRVAPPSTGAVLARGRSATVGTFRAARRGGSMRATARPAA